VLKEMALIAIRCVGIVEEKCNAKEAEKGGLAYTSFGELSASHLDFYQHIPNSPKAPA
jgi:hypothetical protein